MIDPWLLTEEEIEELIQMSKPLSGEITSSNNPDFGIDIWHRDYGNIPPKIEESICRHKWMPVLLLYTTVYNCKHCGKNREDI